MTSHIFPREFLNSEDRSEPVSVLCRYYPALRSLSIKLQTEAEPAASFRPPFALPPWREAYRDFLTPAQITLHSLGTRMDTPIHLLQLAGDPATQTTKSVASYLMVLRAIHHIETTGERITIVTPSSGNKATALRAAVARAHLLGLASPEQLGIVSIVPASSLHKMRRDSLFDDRDRQRLNPLLTWSGAHRDQVKEAAQKFVSQISEEAFEKRGVRLWFSLDLRNYRMADIARALFLAEHMNADTVPTLTHLHAVSSAYGLLGYHWGHELVESLQPGLLPAPPYFLIQHLATPYMVQHWHTGGFEPIPESAYSWDEEHGWWHQDALAYLPQRTWSLSESIDSTFYTRKPATSPEMSGLMRKFGGGGIVVSLLECMARYGEVRSLFEQGGLSSIPSDPRLLSEHSGLMAVTGCIEALQRGSLERGMPVLIHHSGTYRKHDYQPVTSHDLHPASGDDVEAMVDGLIVWSRENL